MTCVKAMRSTFWIHPLLISAILLGACAPGRDPATGPMPQPVPMTTIEVQNQSTSDMRIYVVDGGRRVRLGSVTGTGTATFRIPDSIVAGGRDLVFQADPLAGRQVANSFSIYVAPGEQIQMTIPPAVR